MTDDHNLLDWMAANGASLIFLSSGWSVYLPGPWTLQGRYRTPREAIWAAMQQWKKDVEPALSADS